MFSHNSEALSQNPKKCVNLLVLRQNLWKTILDLWKTFGESVDNLWKALSED
ncbi:MAG: hypothetical protein WA885_10575 [Phormidesmis sp.]